MQRQRAFRRDMPRNPPLAGYECSSVSTDRISIAHSDRIGNYSSDGTSATRMPGQLT